MPKRSRPPNEQPSCGHNHDSTNKIPLDLDAVVSALREAIHEIQAMLQHLKNHGRLESESTQPRKEPATEQQQVCIEVQVNLAIGEKYNDMHSLMYAHEKEYWRKWGDSRPEGIYHDLIRVYPKFEDETNRDRRRHDEIYEYQRVFNETCWELRKEARRVYLETLGKDHRNSGPVGHAEEEE